jgi:hypothetical protein
VDEQCVAVERERRRGPPRRTFDETDRDLAELELAARELDATARAVIAARCRPRLVTASDSEASERPRRREREEQARDGENDGACAAERGPRELGVRVVEIGHGLVRGSVVRGAVQSGSGHGAEGAQKRL